ncbi:unnamed protein product, partial [Brassica rapa]
AFHDWNELLSWIRSSVIQSPILLRKLAVQSTIYHLGKQRNNVYHNNIQGRSQHLDYIYSGFAPDNIIIGPAVIARMIYREVRNTIM